MYKFSVLRRSGYVPKPLGSIPKYQFHFCLFPLMKHIRGSFNGSNYAPVAKLSREEEFREEITSDELLTRTKTVV